MKPTGHLWRRFENRLVRMRHFRGHGVHSPYIYTLVREVFMVRRNPVATFDPLFEATLRQAGLSQRAARELQQIGRRCGCKTWGVDREGDEMTFLTRKASEELCRRVLLQAQGTGRTVVVVKPYADRERVDLCDRIIAAHPSASVDRGNYILLFNNHLPKQHFLL